MKFGTSDTKPDLFNGDWYCLKDSDGSEYCIYFECPEVKCSSPLPSEKGNCQYCPGNKNSELIYEFFISNLKLDIARRYNVGI